MQSTDKSCPFDQLLVDDFCFSTKIVPGSAPELLPLDPPLNYCPRIRSGTGVMHMACNGDVLQFLSYLCIHTIGHPMNSSMVLLSFRKS